MLFQSAADLTIQYKHGTPAHATPARVTPAHATPARATPAHGTQAHGLQLQVLHMLLHLPYDAITFLEITLVPDSSNDSN